VAVLIRQLKDDLAEFYPITCVEAVVGGTLSEATIPTTIELSQYITENFTISDTPGLFRMYQYDSNLLRIVLEVDKNPYYNITPGGNNIIAEGMPVAYYPERPIVLKTLTDDVKSKAVVLWDIDGKVRLCVLPHEEIEVVSNTEIRRSVKIHINQISAVGIRIK